MIDRADLLKSLQALLPHIEKDILAYSEANEDLNVHLQTEYRAAVEAERSAEHFVSWREAQITQAAVAWVLICVFVRFLEDNGLLTEPVLAGPVSDAQGRNALQQAKERMVAYFNERPTFEERHYLLDLFAELEKFPVIAELLDHSHNPLWQIPVSADGAKRLIDFFQKIDADSGEILHDFTDPEWDTRFLGDLYQDLSESVRKRYALLQTPEFVESFILDYTLEPAIQTFGLSGLRLIDPTCGSGHFLLTTFERVFNQWLKREPGTNARELAQRALDVVHGTDINPYAIAICRFRLLIAAMKAAGSTKIKDAPSFYFNLACGDSLLHGRRFEWQGQGIQGGLLDEEKKHVYEVEDPEKLEKILGQRYHVVVGNPPYITVKDKALNQAYRDKYPTCHRKYSLGAPFTERFFDLTLCFEGNQSAGFMGMITANSFMKREFGKKLIEDYLPHKDLTHVIDTAGAYIPGHGTPTVILFARNQAPKSDFVRAVLGIRGEPGAPDDAALGKVWSSIVSLVSMAGSENDYISVVDQDRVSFSSHPWSMGGGGAAELKELIDCKAGSYLGSYCLGIGFGVITGEDDVYLLPRHGLKDSVGSTFARNFVEGEAVRDWINSSKINCIFPYQSSMKAAFDNSILNRLWPTKVVLRSRVYFGKTQDQRGLQWYEYGYISRDKSTADLLISFASVSTHNHFVLERGPKVFKQSAPLIELKSGATEAQHFSILGLLNSSTACFWMKQVFYPKGGDHVGNEGARVRKTQWEERYDHAGTGLKKFPIAEGSLSVIQSFSEKLDKLGQRLAMYEPEVCLNNVGSDLVSSVSNARAIESSLWMQMIALQEELDWYTYFLYGLTDEAFCYQGDLPEVRLGERAFEIQLARKTAIGDADSTWFERHGSTPITEIPEYWPAQYKMLIQRRLQAIEKNQWIQLIEQPEYKRRWSRDSWEVRLHSAAKEWLLDHMEKACQSPELQTCAQVADRLRGDVAAIQIAELYCGDSFFDLQALVCELVDGDNVPQMAVSRLKVDALPKFRAWQGIWHMQRLEDAIDAKYGVNHPLLPDDAQDPEKRATYGLKLAQAKLEKADRVGDIPLPPRYRSTDFRKPCYWSLRGKLDVPKERFFSLPGCEKGGDSTLVIGGARLNHLQRAQAIASWYLGRKDGEGWEVERLMPMLVALDELIPWLKQWHNEVDPEFGERMGDYYEGFLLEELRNLEITRAELMTWQPAAVASNRGGRKTRAAQQS
ncbi:BREX-2 system adenine-specific DNA-methyltransferase PglX [Pseudomonas corrugata]|uniref:BREX-2 system adenine-specific DNA-methyltransferase PglX n=1 Tax=Pseudomonas corrugata TaxID=47879 RepID=UPI0009BC8A3D|nr:BREX-2 system adenine-specific DNA-methyltransferase PglX [Pseudomonas corrugata]